MPLDKSKKVMLSHMNANVSLLGCNTMWICRYERFGGTYCLRPEDEGIMFLRNVGIYLHGVTTQNTNIDIFTAMRNSYPINVTLQG
jgi:hypothetical protein